MKKSRTVKALITLALATVGVASAATLAWAAPAMTAGPAGESISVQVAADLPTGTVEPTGTVTPTGTVEPTVTPTPDETNTPATVVASSTVRIHVMGRTHRGDSGATVTMVNVATGGSFGATAGSHGWVRFSSVPYGTYTVTATLANGHVLTRTITVGHRMTTLQLKDHRAKTAKMSPAAKKNHDSHMANVNKAKANSMQSNSHAAAQSHMGTQKH